MFSFTNGSHNGTVVPFGNASLGSNISSLPNSTSSSHDCEFDTAFRIVICLLLGVTMIIASISNILVCIAIISSRKLRTLTNSLLVSLSMSDVIISLTLPICEIIYVAYYPDWPLGRLGTYVLNSVWMFSLASPFVSLMVITFDRYMVITSNAVDNVWRTPRSIALAIVMTWLYSAGVVTLMAFHFTWPGHDAYEWNVLVEWYYPFICIHIVVPILVITILYIKIIHTSRLSRSKASFHANTNAVAMTRREIRLAQTVSIVIGLLFFVWLPVLVMEYFYAVESESCLVSKLGVVSVWVTCVNGMINPFVYGLRSHQLRKGVLDIICCGLRCRQTAKQSGPNVKQSSKTTESDTVGDKTPWRTRTLYKGSDGNHVKSTETIDSQL